MGGGQRGAVGDGVDDVEKTPYSLLHLPGPPPPNIPPWCSVDVDKFDYLQRDALMCGVDIGCSFRRLLMLTKVPQRGD